jgi:hypothetical protein
MTIEQNRADLVRHRSDFERRVGFTYSVLADREGAETVIGCVYIYPSTSTEPDRPEAVVLSWVRAADAPLDAVLAGAVRDWLARAWPFETIEYAARDEPAS